MIRTFKHGVAAVLLTACVITSSGCIGLLVGAAAGAGGYAWIKGALVKEFEAPAEKMHGAAVAALRDLKLTIVEDKYDRLSARVVAEFSDGAKATVSIDAKTERVSSVKIRVGVFGDKTKSEMILQAIQKRV